MSNVGSVDRIVRVVLGIVLLVVPFVPAAAIMLAGMGGWIWVLPIVGIVLLATAAMRFCPLYRVLGLRTCRVS